MQLAEDRSLKIRNFPEWHPELDAALQNLPETDVFPHELFRTVMKLADPAKRRLILVTEKGEPVALAGLRNRWGYWEPVTQWIVPGTLFPIKKGYIGRVLPVLKHDLHVAWWRWGEPPPNINFVENVKSTPTHGMPLDENYEKFWRTTSHYRNLRSYNNRCKEFVFKINPAGGCERTIRSWEEKWRPNGMKEMPDLTERILIADYLQRKGLYYSTFLYDRDDPIAGATVLIHGKDVVAQCNYRKPEYNWHGVMSHLIHMQFMWAKDMGYEKFDIGGSFEYKDKWAPENGYKWEFEIRQRRNMLFKLSRKIRDRIAHF